MSPFALFVHPLFFLPPFAFQFIAREVFMFFFSSLGTRRAQRCSRRDPRREFPPPPFSPTYSCASRGVAQFVFSVIFVLLAACGRLACAHAATFPPPPGLCLCFLGSSFIPAFSLAFFRSPCGCPFLPVLRFFLWPFPWHRAEGQLMSSRHPFFFFCSLFFCRHSREW